MISTSDPFVAITDCPILDEFLRQANCDHPALPALVDLTNLWEVAGSPADLEPRVWNEVILDAGGRDMLEGGEFVKERVYATGRSAYVYALTLDDRLEDLAVEYRQRKRHRNDWVQPLIDQPSPLMAFMAMGDLMIYREELSPACAASYLIDGAESLTEDLDPLAQESACAVRNEPDLFGGSKVTRDRV